MMQTNANRLQEYKLQEYKETLAYIEQQERSWKLLVVRPDQPLKSGMAEKNTEELVRGYQICHKIASQRLHHIQNYEFMEDHHEKA